MKGVILAGGTGSRLHPLTAVTNKHLLPLYDKPVIYYPIEKLVEAGITEILIITGHEYTSHFVRLLGEGEALGAKLHYAVQLEPNGIADALRMAENFANGEKIAVILGDNVFEDSIKDAAEQFMKVRGAAVFLNEHENAKDYGVVEIKNGKIIDIEEKPVQPKSNLCAAGLYFYDSDVFTIIRELKPSVRGEYEITDVNKMYLKQGRLHHFLLNGKWFDCGNFYYLLKAGLFIARKNHGFNE